MTDSPRNTRRREPRGAPRATDATAPGQATRRVAFEALTAVLRAGRPLDAALLDAPAFQRLESRDRAFARQLVSTTLRRLGQIDAAIARCLDRPLKAKLAAVQDVLRLGAAQILFLDTARHAAVSETVSLAGSLRATGAPAGAHRGLVNAVLRRLDREGTEILAGQDAARVNTPDWLWASWEAAYGPEAARAIGRAHLVEAPLDISLRDPSATADWAQTLGGEPLPRGGLRLPGGQGDIRRLPGFVEGQWWVQDAAAQWPARLLGPVAGRRVIDLCAAPGGKALQLAAGGAEVTAVDRSEARLVQLHENLARTGLAARVVAADAVEWRPDAPADAVLLDAPCSATGTLRRHPDIARLKHPKDIAPLVELQRRLLLAACEMLPPGGRLVYAVCSLQPEEGPALIESALAAGAPLVLEPLDAASEGLPAEMVTPEGCLRTLPAHLAERGGMDGFFAARLRRG